MNNEELYKQISDFLIGKYVNKWYLNKFELEGKEGMFEVKCNSRGYIHIRKPFKTRNNADGEKIFIYNVYRFTDKKELVYSHMEEVHESTIKEIYNEYKSRTLQEV
jgi:hypothetical protein